VNEIETMLRNSDSKRTSEASMIAPPIDNDEAVSIRAESHREIPLTLIERDHEPSEEGLVRETSTLSDRGKGVSLSSIRDRMEQMYLCQLLIKFRVEESDVFVNITIENEGEDGEHRISCCVTDHQPSLIDCDWRATNTKSVRCTDSSIDRRE